MLTHVEALERFASRSASALSRRCGTGCGAARCASANAIRSCSREDTTLSKRAVCSLSRVAALPSSTAVPTAAFRSASSASDTVAAREDQDAIHSRGRLNLLSSLRGGLSVAEYFCCIRRKPSRGSGGARSRAL